jgi:hypothetical protein
LPFSGTESIPHSSGYLSSGGAMGAWLKLLPVFILMVFVFGYLILRRRKV